MGRLRARLDRLESHAHSTMSGGEQLIAMIKDLVQDLGDGISIKVTVLGKDIPITIKIDPRD